MKRQITSDIIPVPFLSLLEQFHFLEQECSEVGVLVLSETHSILFLRNDEKASASPSELFQLPF